MCLFESGVTNTCVRWCMTDKASWAGPVRVQGWIRELLTVQWWWVRQFDINDASIFRVCPSFPCRQTFIVAWLKIICSWVPGHSGQHLVNTSYCSLARYVIFEPFIIGIDLANLSTRTRLWKTRCESNYSSNGLWDELSYAPPSFNKVFRKFILLYTDIKQFPKIELTRLSLWTTKRASLNHKA